MVSLAPFVQKRPWLLKMLQPVAQWYMGSAGYRQMGLRYVFAQFEQHNGGRTIEVIWKEKQAIDPGTIELKWNQEKGQCC